MRQVKDVLRLKFEAGLSHDRIAGALHLSKGVVTKYLQRAAAAGLSWPLPARTPQIQHSVAVVGAEVSKGDRERGFIAVEAVYVSVCANAPVVWTLAFTLASALAPQLQPFLLSRTPHQLEVCIAGRPQDWCQRNSQSSDPTGGPWLRRGNFVASHPSIFPRMRRRPFPPY